MEAVVANTTGLVQKISFENFEASCIRHFEEAEVRVELSDFVLCPFYKLSKITGVVRHTCRGVPDISHACCVIKPRQAMLMRELWF